jgi:diguanylate cyclase (GGDEF)-like protein
MSDRARILVADDDPDIRNLIRRVLAPVGYDVIATPSGAEALRLTRSECPDLLILDVGLPDRDGYQVCRETQSVGLTAPPVIFLTAHSDPEHRVQGLDAGAVDYVAKPFDVAELRARVRAALRGKAQRDALALAAETDALTELFNRRQLERRGTEMVALAARYQRPLASQMVDVEHFKRVNDNHGHDAGDAVLCEVARRLRAVSRSSDVVARYGGEEFTLLLPETETASAVAVAEKLREEMGDRRILLPRAGTAGRVAGNVAGDAQADGVSVRVSVGVAAWQEGMDLAALIAAADAALYQAKEGGRDRVAVAPPSYPPQGQQ